MFTKLGGAMIGKTISHYRITREIGTGGMGVVYEAVDINLDRPVALKFLPPESTGDPESKARFVHEAKAASALDHPNICTIYEIGDNPDGELFIAMAYYEGKDLQEVMAERTVTQDEAVDIICRLAEGVAQAHRQGIIHQDINPRNVMLLNDGQVKLLDFGVAKLVGKSQTVSKDSSVGTIAYMAPEQIQSERVGAATDVWALGVLLYELLSGRQLFKGRYLHEVIYKIVNAEPEGIRGLPTTLATIMDKALQKKSGLRYKDAGDFLAALAPERTPAEGVLPRSGFFPPRKVWLPLAVFLTAVLVIGIYQMGSFRQVEFNKRDLLLVTEFENRTGEEVFDGTIRQALSYELGQSPYVSLFTGRLLSDALERMKQDPGATIDPELGRELGEREGVAAVLEGTISKIENSYLIGARLINPVTGETGDTKSVMAENKGEVFRALDELARNIRKDLGESLLSIARRDVPLARVTTSSLQALRYYTQGENHLLKADWEKAATFYQEAVAIDSTFAIAYSKLGRVFFHTARTNDALIYSARAMDHREKLSDREKYYIEAEYFRYRDDFDKAIEKFALLLGENPNDEDVRINLVATYMLSNRYESALAELQNIAEPSANNWYVHFALGNAYGGLGRYDDAREEFTRVLSIQQRQVRTLDNLSWIHVCKGDMAGARAMQDSLAGKSDRPSVSLEYRQAKFHFYLGEGGEALDHLQKALGEVRRSGNTSQESWILTYRALVHDRSGRYDQSIADLTQVTELWKGDIPRFTLGRALVLSGNIQGAEQILVLLESSDSREMTHTRRGLAHRLRGLIHFQGGRFKQCAEEIGLSITILPDYEPRLLLAQAHLAMREFDQARDALRPVVEFPFVSYLRNEGDAWPRALALWGRIAETEGQKSEAVEYYKKALAIWANADPDHQEMLEARSRLAELIPDG